MEFMTNMKKHSNCNLVVVKIEFLNDNLNINYNDNGDKENNTIPEKNNGLRNVENRISSIKGKITFDLEKGFKASISIPITTL